MPTLNLKLAATTLSGALMGMAGAPLPYYVTYLDSGSSFNLSYAVNSVAMPVIGGMTSWIGPVIGAILLGTIQQLATVTISSALNLLIVGVLLILFVIMLLGVDQEEDLTIEPLFGQRILAGVAVAALLASLIVAIVGVIFFLVAHRGKELSEHLRDDAETPAALR